jgi:hypothetical protein
MARVHPPRYTAEDSFQSPPCHSAFNGGGVLELDAGGGGVQNRVACEVGPPPVMSTTVSHFPLCHLYST